MPPIVSVAFDSKPRLGTFFYLFAGRKAKLPPLALPIIGFQCGLNAAQGSNALKDSLYSFLRVFKKVLISQQFFLEPVQAVLIGFIHFVQDFK